MPCGVPRHLLQYSFDRRAQSLITYGQSLSGVLHGPTAHRRTMKFWPRARSTWGRAPSPARRSKAPRMTGKPGVILSEAVFRQSELEASARRPSRAAKSRAQRGSSGYLACIADALELGLLDERIP
jgi:hypothetical protein